MEECCLASTGVDQRESKVIQKRVGESSLLRCEVVERRADLVPTYASSFGVI
jgi:hypothetical protein